MPETTPNIQTAPTFDPTRRYRCRHVFTEGQRCGSPSLRGQDLCYYHHASRRQPSLAGQNGYFLMPRIDDRPAIQIALYDVLARLSQFDIDPKRAGMLLYGLQIASSNLTKHQKSAANTEPVVEDIVSNPFLGDLAPIAEIPEPEAPTEAVPEPQTEPAPIEVVILSAAKNPRIQPAAPPTTGDAPQCTPAPRRDFPTRPCKPRSNPQPATLILAAVQAVAAPTARTCSNLEPRTSYLIPRTSYLEPSPALPPIPPSPTPYNGNNDFVQYGLPASPRHVPLPG